MNSTQVLLLPTGADTAEEALFAAEIASVVLTDDDAAAVGKLAPGSLDAVLLAEQLFGQRLVVSKNMAGTLIATAPSAEALARLGLPS